MKKEEALEFLSSHEYISEEVSQDTIDRFDEVRKYFISNPSIECVPLFLNAFGDHMGWGLFQICDDVFRPHSPTELAPHLKAALKSKREGTVWWASHWATEFATIELKEELLEIAKKSEFEDAQFFTISALQFIEEETNDREISDYLDYRTTIEKDPEILEVLNERTNT